MVQRQNKNRLRAHSKSSEFFMQLAIQRKLKRLFFACLAGAIMLLVLLCLALSCSRPEVRVNQDSATQDKTLYQAIKRKGDTIHIEEGAAVLKHVSTIQVHSENKEQAWSTAGVVRVIPTEYAEVAAPFAGRVLESFVRLGQKVQVGQALFSLSSPEYFSAQKDYFDAKQSYQLAKLQFKRQQDLLSNGVGVQRDLEEAETNYQLEASSLANAGEALKIFNVQLDRVQLGKPLIVCSPIVGEVLSYELVIGQYIRDDAPALLSIAALDQIWVTGHVKERYLYHIPEVSAVQIQVAGLPGETFPGKIYHVNEQVDEVSRSVEVLISCDNKQRLLKPGMYVTVNYKDRARPSIRVPSRAVFQGDKHAFVFVQIGKNSFRKQIVEGTDTEVGYMVLTRGLKDGEKIVDRGGIYLLQK